MKIDESPSPVQVRFLIEKALWRSNYLILGCIRGRGNMIPRLHKFYFLAAFCMIYPLT